MKAKAVDQHSIRHTNQYLILQQVLEQETVTRSTLSKALKLSAPSVSSNIEDLLSRNVLQESGLELHHMNKLGRKGVLLEFNKDYIYLMVIDLSGIQMKVSISNMYREIIAQHSIPFPEEPSASLELRDIYDAAEQVLALAAIDKRKLGCILVASPGIVHEKKEEISHMPKCKNLENCNLVAQLEQHFHTTVLLKNDINVFAIGEHIYGQNRRVDDFVHINVEYGVGAGIIIDGKIHRGSHYSSGEVGFFLPDIRMCQPNSQQGAFESQVIMPQIRRNAARAIGLPTERATISEINFYYKKGHPSLVAEIDRVAALLAHLIASIAVIIDVELITIGGSIKQLEVDLIPRIKQHIGNYIPFLPEIAFSKLDDDGCTKGAMVLGTDYLIETIAGTQAT